MSLTTAEIRRYARHIILPEVGGRGQLKLKQASVALVGLGAVASVAGQYLVAAGIGRIVLEALPGANVSGAWWAPGEEAATLQRANPAVHLEPGPAQADVTIVTADDLPAAYHWLQALQAIASPTVLIWPAGHAGYAITVLTPETPCRDCWLAATQTTAQTAPQTGGAPSVLPTAPGSVGSVAATEAIKAILGIGDLLVGRVLTFDVATSRFAEQPLPHRPGCTCAE